MLHFLTYLGKMLAVGVAQCIVLLCAAVVCHRFPAVGPGMLGFLMLCVPMVLAFGGYCYLTWRELLSSYESVRKLIFTLLIGFVSLAISTTCCFTVYCNIWGT
jgi:hypothetical protein